MPHPSLMPSQASNVPKNEQQKFSEVGEDSLENESISISEDNCYRNHKPIDFYDNYSLYLEQVCDDEVPQK